MSYHIVNARIVNEGTITDGDLTVVDGRILGVNAQSPASATVVDAAGAYLLPGMSDEQQNEVVTALRAALHEEAA